MRVHRRRGAVIATGLTVVALSCSELDGLSSVEPGDAQGGKPSVDAPGTDSSTTNRGTDSSTTNPRTDSSTGPSDANPDADSSPNPDADGSHDARRDGADGPHDAGSDRADASVEPRSDAGDGGSEDGAGNEWPWEVASAEQVRQSGVVQVLASRAQCSGVLISHHWVLTAAHCLCNEDLGSARTAGVIVGGKRLVDSAPPDGVVYASKAANVEVHPTYDVALIELENAVPFKVTPLLYDGVDGRELNGAIGRVWGYGPHRLDDVGQPIGAGETLTSAPLRIHGSGIVGNQLEHPANCALPQPAPSSDGPLAGPVSGAAPRVIQEGEGGPLFFGGDDLETRVLVGILKGTTSSAYAFTGIWAIRDWIRDTAHDLSLRSRCSEPLPNSAGMSLSAAAPGPDGRLHVVAVATDGTLHHWQRAADGTVVGPAMIAGARTDLRPGLGTELEAPPGDTPTLGLAFRDPQTRMLHYMRWTPSGWSSATVLPGSQDARAVSVSGGCIGWVTPDNQLIPHFYHHVVAGNAPLPSIALADFDVARGISIHYNLGFGPVVWGGYRTTQNQWTQFRGNLYVPDGGGLAWQWIESVFPATNWENAMLTGVASAGPMIVATRPAGASSVVEHFHASPATGEFLPLGSNRLAVSDDIAPATVDGNDVWVISSSNAAEPPGLMLRRSTDCFANDW